MKEIRVAKHAGFCYGVKRAYDMALEFKDSNPEKTVNTYGPLIHNKGVIQDLENKGIVACEDIDDASGDLLLIRAHGVSKDLIEQAGVQGFNIVDATCPYVKKIHRIVESASDRGDYVIVIGDADHPEIKGIVGHCKSDCLVIRDLNAAKEYKCEDKFRTVSTVVQTTYNSEKYKDVIAELKNKVEHLNEYFTICSATTDRQKEVVEIAENSDFVIVLGGKNSSNTKKLYEIIAGMGKKCKHIENFFEIEFENFQNYGRIGVVAGASTPKESIDQLLEYLRIKTK